jgi:hypothetical protein
LEVNGALDALARAYAFRFDDVIASAKEAALGGHSLSIETLGTEDTATLE